ncbi:MAG: LPXTG cell wall anchor domain-containing protein [Polyangiaceae bacterium]
MQAAKPDSGGDAAARVLVERPPPGLLRGRAESSVWLLAALGLAALLLLASFYVRKLRRKQGS